MAEPVHSTASEGAVSHVDKYGESMPILQKTSIPTMYYVKHEGKEIGMLQHFPGPGYEGKPRWASHHPPSEAKPRGHVELHHSKRDAIDFLFGPPGNAPD